MNANVVRGLAVTIALLLGGGVMAAGAVEHRGTTVMDDSFGPDHTRKTYIDLCSEKVAAEVDRLIVTGGDFRSIFAKRGDPYFPIINETYRQFVSDSGLAGHMTRDAALHRASDRIEAWCTADADKN